MSETFNLGTVGLIMASVRLQLEEEEEAEDTFDVDVAVTNPEKIGQCAFKEMF